MQKCVDDIQEWYEQNKLVINRSKSNVMLVTTRQMFYHMVDKELNVLIDNQKLLQCTSMTYLGVEIDNTFSDYKIDRLELLQEITIMLIQEV